MVFCKNPWYRHHWTVGTYWLKIGKSEDQVEGEIDKIKTK